MQKNGFLLKEYFLLNFCFLLKNVSALNPVEYRR